MKDGISQYGRIIIVVLVLLTLIGFIFGGMYLYRIGGFSDTIPDGVEDSHINRAPPTLNVQDQTTLVDKEINIRSIISAFNADGEDISNKIVIECEDETVFNQETGIFKSSKAGKFTLLLSVMDTGTIDGKEYTTKSTKRMTIIVDNTVGQHTITIVTVNNGVLLTNTRIAKAETVIKFMPKPDTGYEFDGIDAVCVNDKNIVVTSDLNRMIMPDDDVVITPKWKPVKVNVLLNANKGKIEGETVFSKTFNEPYGELPGNNLVTRTGYEFAGWSLTRDGSSMITSSTIIASPNAHYLYAQWKQKEYTITFDPMNGENTFTKTVKYGERVGEITIPTREGYTFRGWTLKDDNKTVINANTKFLFNDNIEVIAVWQPRSGFVKLDANGGTVTPRQVKIYYGQTYNTLPDAYKMGYKFLGWFTEKNGGVKIKTTDIVDSIVTRTLYAHWQKETYTITFNATPGLFNINGTTVSEVTDTVEYQGKISLPENIPTYNNREFLGWYTSMRGGVKISDGDIFEYSSDKSFYAHWDTSKFTVTFDANGGTLTSFSSFEVGFGSPYGQLPSAKKTGYRLVGWFTEKDGGTQVNSSTIMNLEADHVLYAHWELMSYNITFKYKDDNVTRFPNSKTISVLYSNEIPTLESEDFTEYPERTGYVFSHWTLEDGTVIYAGQSYLYETDIVLYPVWDKASVIYVNSLDAAQALANKSNSDLVTFKRLNPVNAEGHYVLYDKSENIGVANIYEYNTNIVSVVISDIVTSINASAFNGCNKLASININADSNIESIGDRAFFGCGLLSGELVLPKKLTTLGGYAFSDCSSLSSLDITKATELTAIPAYCFRNCTSLNNTLSIPANIATIGDSAFSHCPFGGGLSIAKDITNLNIGQNAFEYTNFNCPLDFRKLTNIEKLTIGNKAFLNSTISSLFFPEEIQVFSIDSYAFHGSSIKNGSDDIAPLVIPKYITDLPYSCFGGCTLLSIVVLPDETMSYGGNLFNGCSGLTKVTLPCNVPMSSGMFYGTNIKELVVTPGLTDSNISTSNTFYSVSDVLNYRLDNSANSLLKIKGYMELTKNYTSAPWASTLQTAVVQDGVLNLSNYLFNGCANLNSLTVPVDCNIVNGTYYHKDYTVENGYMESLLDWKDVLYDGCERYSDFYGSSCKHCDARGLTSTNTHKYSLSNTITNCTDYIYDSYIFTGATNIKTLIFTKGLGKNGVVGQSADIKPEDFKAKLAYVYDPLTNHSSLKSLIPWIENSTLTTAIIEPGVVLVPERMFSAAKGLSNIKMPCNLRPRPSTFADCSGVKNVTITTGFDYNNNIATKCYDYVTVLSGTKEACYDDAPWYNAEAVNITIEEGVTALGKNMFNTAALDVTSKFAISQLTLPSTLTTITDTTFENTKFANAIITTPIGLDYTPASTDYNSSGTISEIILIDSPTIKNYTSSDYYYTPWGFLCKKGNENGKSFKLTIMDGVREIPNYCFYNSSIAGQVTVPDSVTRIGTNAFGSSTVNAVVLSKGITSIPDNAFSEATSLTSITIPDSVTSIGNNSFYGCTNLQDMYYLGTINDWAKIDFVSAESNPMLYAKNEYFNNQKLTDVTFSEDVTEIKNYAFCGCDSITSVIIGENISSIGKKAFADCTSLNSVKVSDDIENIDATAFENTAYYNNEENWENGVLYMGKILVKAKETIAGSYEIKEGTTIISENAFSNCTALTDIVMPNSVTQIKHNAFTDCTALNSVVFSSNLTHIGESAFYNCASLKDMHIPDSVTSVGDGFLYGCNALETLSTGNGITDFSIVMAFNTGNFNTTLKSITLGKNTHLIDELYLANFIGLTEINVSADNNEYSSTDGVLYNKDQTRLVRVPSMRTEETFTIPSSVITIDAHALCYNAYIKHIIIPVGVKQISEGTFGSLISLETITFLSPEIVIADGALVNCENLTTIKGPANSNAETWATENGLTYVEI